MKADNEVHGCSRCGEILEQLTLFDKGRITDETTIIKENVYDLPGEGNAVKAKQLFWELF